MDQFFEAVMFWAAICFVLMAALNCVMLYRREKNIKKAVKNISISFFIFFTVGVVWLVVFYLQRIDCSGWQ